METGSCSCGDWDEGPRCYTDARVTARRSWRCIECGAEIKPGETYSSEAGFFDGAWFRDPTCITCYRIGLDWCAPVGGLRDAIWDSVGVDYITGDVDPWPGWDRESDMREKGLDHD